MDQLILLHLRALESVIHSPIQRVAICASVGSRKPPTPEKKKPAAALVFDKPRRNAENESSKNFSITIDYFFMTTVQNFALTSRILLDPAE